MLSLTQPLDNEIEIEGNLYKLNLSFDNVIRWYQLMQDDKVNEYGKIEIAFMMFIIDCPNVDIEVKISTVHELSKYLSGKTDDDEENDGTYELQKEYFNFEQDANYIYSAFRQQYGINLIKEKGKLRWEEFIALLNGLSNNTKFMEIVDIRATDPPTGNDPSEIAERNRLLKLKQIYALESDKNVAYMEAQMDAIFGDIVKFANTGKEGTVNE